MHWVYSCEYNFAQNEHYILLEPYKALIFSIIDVWGMKTFYLIEILKKNQQILPFQFYSWDAIYTYIQWKKKIIGQIKNVLDNHSSSRAANISEFERNADLFLQILFLFKPKPSIK